MRDPARDATFDIDDHIAVLEFQALIGRRPPCNTRVLPAYPEWTHVSDCRLRDLNSRPTVYKARPERTGRALPDLNRLIFLTGA